MGTIAPVTTFLNIPLGVMLVRQSKAKNLGILVMCLGFFCLSSCKKVSNDFLIKDPTNTISSAEIRLCNKRLQLTRTEGEFRGEMPITCEGEGNILVHVSDGHETVCKIGYVTPGAEQSFQFVIESGSCRPSSSR